jgi:hypothetical protein
MALAAQVDEIPFAKYDAKKFLRHYVKPGIPAVLRGFARVEAVFSLESYVEHEHCRALTVREFGGQPRAKWQWTDYGRNRVSSWAQFLEWIRDGTASSHDLYVQQDVASNPIGGCVMDLLADWSEQLSLTPLYDSFKGSIWVAPPGHVEPMHSDEGDGSLLQLAGYKSVDLFPPSNLHDLYPFALITRVAPWICRADVDDPDFERFPRLRKALPHRRSTLLAPGDLLFLPTQWTHLVKGVSGDRVVSMNRMWKPRPWHRNLCTDRAALYYLKRQLPQKALINGYAWLQRHISR